MSSFSLTILSKDGTSISFQGDRPASPAGADLTVSQVVVTITGASPETDSLSVLGGLVVPGANIGTGATPSIQSATAAVSLRATLRFGTTSKFFGKAFDATSGLDAELVVSIPAAGGPKNLAEPFLVLTCRGRVEVGAGPVFAAVALGFRVVIDDIPAIPTLVAPALELELPGEINWPRLRLDWAFPRLPDFAPSLLLPAYSIGLANVPVRVGWKLIEVTADITQVKVHVAHLTVSGVGGGIDGSLDLIFKPGQAPDVAVDIPALNGVANLKFITLSPGCFGFDWENSPADPLLQLVTTELSDPTAAARNKFQLRVHASDRQLDEIRLDWLDTGATGRTIRLPGFALDLPAPRMLSLIARRQSQAAAAGDGEARLTLAATFDAGQSATARTTFSWPLGSDREEHELFRDGRDAPAPSSDSLVSLTATTKHAVSLVLFDLPLEGGGSPPRFIQELKVPLAPLDELETDAGADGTGDEVVFAFSDPCPSSDIALAKLSPDDFALALAISGDFVFPFLNDLASAVPQLIKVKGITPTIAADLSITCKIDIEITIGGPPGSPNLIAAQANLSFNPDTMSFQVDHEKGIAFVFTSAAAKTFSLFDLNWSFLPAPQAMGDLPANVAFVLVTKGGNYQLRQAPGTIFELDFDRIAMPGEPIVFRMTDFALGPKGISLTAKVQRDRPARLNGLETPFWFTEGVLKINENRIAGFTIAGSGKLPPALVGDATADVALQFEQIQGALRLTSGAAQIHGSKLLSCKASRFEFELDGLGLRFVEDHGADHLYFTLSGKARFKPITGTDDPSGPLAWLPAIEIQLVDCPLTGNMRVIAQHIKFLIELPKKLKFDFLGCFQMELRAIGFLPQFDKFGDTTSAMQLTGQIMFAEGGGDVLETKIDLHSLYVALPEAGSFIPRVHLKGLGIQIKQGSSFELYGAVDFFNGEDIEPGIPAFGFTGEGSVMIQGLPTIAASFAFLRVSPDQKVTWKRAWFLYLEARKLALQIPVIEIYIREIGLGFGYRYTLAAFKASDQINDPKQLLKALKKISKTQGNLSRRDQWKIDLEGPGEGARWTVALRALVAQTSASQDPFGADYSDEAEKILACLFVLDVVIALRSDLTFFMAGRAWLDTNYNDFLLNQNGLQDKPLFSAFVLLSPRQKRLLANLSSNQDAEFGDHPPLPDFIKTAIRSCKFSATLLIEPGLVHYELGWPNQLQWQAKLGPLEAEFRGGAIFRVSTSELVVGNSFLARGTLSLSAGVDLGFVGASLSALAQVAYGARYIGVLAFVDSIHGSAFYGAIGVEIRVVVDIHFWLHIKIGFFKISFDLHFSFSLNFTASLEVGITLTDLAGARGTATLCIGIMGHDLHFGIRVGINDGAVDGAIGITNRFLHIGLEAEDVEPVPGTETTPVAAAVGSHALVLGSGSAPSVGLGLVGAGLAPAAALSPAPATVSVASLHHTDAARFKTAVTTGIKVPNYSIATAVPPQVSGAKRRTVYFLLVPAAAAQADLTNGFYPPPPGDSTGVTNDFDWTPTAHPPSVTFEQLKPQPTDAGGKNDGIKLTPVDSADYAWKIDWDYFDTRNNVGATKHPTHTLRRFLRYAFLTTPDDDSTKDFGEIVPVGDPTPIMMTSSVGDERVGNPSERAFESAVRGASEQLSSPYFKYDPKSDYDSSMRSAFSEDTSAYSADGKVPTKTIDVPNAPGVHTTVPNPIPAVIQQQRSSQLRGSVIQAILRDFHRYADLDGRNTRGIAGTPKVVLDEIAALEQNSIAFRLGLVFCATVDAANTGDLGWLEGTADAGTIKQRTDPTSSVVDPGPKSVVVFNKATHRFTAGNAPEFTKVRVLAHAKTVAIAWELRWNLTSKSVDRQDDPEHQLRYYKVRRLHLNGDDPEVQFTVKKGDIVHTRTDPKKGGAAETVRLLARFQLVDHFDAETGADVSALTEEGKTYLYTIVPVDLAGSESPRPLSVVATRYPSDPPLVPTDGELVIEYQLEDSFAGLPTVNTLPLVRDDVNVYFQWSDPPDPVNLTSPPIATYQLVFRRETTLPVGFYGADQDTRGGRTAGFPTTNARTLRTDLVHPWSRADAKIQRSVEDPENPGQKLKADNGRHIFQFPIDLNDLESLGVFPAKAGGVRRWRPEAWRVFIQTVTPAVQDNPGVPSALAAVSIRIRFLSKPRPASTVSHAPAVATSVPAPFKLEERQLGLVEWLPDPVRFNPLPSRDQEGTAGFAHVPMPTIEDPQSWSALAVIKASPTGANPIPGLTYEPHPDQTRAIRFVWNQGPSDDPDHPIDLHARYQLFEFDADAKTGDALNLSPSPPETTTIDFQKWVDQAGLRLAQEIELLPADDLPLVPADTLSPLSWEAWYPSISRRLALVTQMKKDGLWPSQTQAKLSPWYSFRDSYLLWPDPLTLVVKGVRTAKFHPFLQALIDQIKGLLDDTPEKFPTYTVEVNPLPARGSSTPEVNSLPAKPSLLDAFLKDTALASDPFGWNTLQRMGLSVAFRVRSRLTGDYLEGLELTNLVRGQLQFVLATQVKATGPAPGVTLTFSITASDDGVSYELSGALAVDLAKGTTATLPKGKTATLTTLMTAGGVVLRHLGKATLAAVSPAGLTLTQSDSPFTGLLKHLHVEHLFQPGKRTSLGKDDPPAVESLLALMQVSLRPALQQRMQYRKAKVTTTDFPALKPGQLVSIKFNASSNEASFLIQSGTLGDEVELPNGNDITYHTIMPSSGVLSILLRGQSPLKVKVLPVKSDGTALDATVDVKPVAFAPTQWESTHFTVPKLAPWETAGDEKASWDNLTKYLQGVNAGLAPPPAGDPIGRPAFLAWLDRFFGTGGDVDPLSKPDLETKVAATGSGSWIASAYPRAATPIALTPDAAGRITYDHLIEDLWAHIYRYFIRPQGRYDLIWRSIGVSPALYSSGSVLEFARRLRQIDLPDDGGLDLVLDRYKPLAPPLVLSSRRLDAQGAPGQAVAPGAIWEVLVAKHPEQELIERNRSLVDHLSYRQLACTLLRSFAFDVANGSDPSVKDQLAKLLGQFVSGLYLDALSPVATNASSTLELVVGAATHSINLSGSNRVDLAVKAINNLALAGLTASIAPTAAGPVRILLTISPLVFPLDLRTLAGDPTSNLLSQAIDLGTPGMEPVTGSLILEGSTFRASGLPEPVSAPEWLDPTKADLDDTLSLDLPLRLGPFGQGAVALQYRALPFYYSYKMLLVAQAAKVVSPITEVNQTDFHYISPMPSAEMEGATFPGGRARHRRITFDLGRFWDSLAPETQVRWEIENPVLDAATVNRRNSSLPDPGVIYQVVISRPSGVVETLAEYRFNPAADAVTGYESRPLPGPFRGDVVRLLPPPEGVGSGAARVRLETLLSPTGSAAVLATPSTEPITGRRAFAAAVGKIPVVLTAPPQSCVMRIEGPLDSGDIAALLSLINDPVKPRDVSFASAIRSLASQAGPVRIAVASIGLEQLAEISDSVGLPSEAVRKVTWNGAISPDQVNTIHDWEIISPFTKTLDALLKALASAVHTEPVPASSSNPAQASLDPKLGLRLTIGATQVTWSKLLTDPPTSELLTKLGALRDLTRTAGLTAFAAAIDKIIAVATDPSGVATPVNVVEPGWHERPAGPPDRLKDRLLIGYGLLGFRDLMIREEGTALVGLAGLTLPDKAAVARLFADSLNSGLGDGRLQIRARRGSATPVPSDIVVTLSLDS